MNARWYIAKYMDDLRRREPKNVGVLLFTDRGVQARFRGDTGDKIDGRLVRGTFGSLTNYKAWVAYWKAVAAENKVADLLKRRAADNYFVELGGERVWGNESVEPQVFADQLFHELVDDKPDLAIELDATHPVKRAFARLKITDKVKENPAPIIAEINRGVRDSLYFDYRYDNGITALMREVYVPKDAGNIRALRDKLHSTAWTFEQALKVDARARMVALLSWGEGVDPQESIEYLRATCANVVDASTDDDAAKGLIAALGLPVNVGSIS